MPTTTIDFLYTCSVVYQSWKDYYPGHFYYFLLLSQICMCVISATTKSNILRLKKSRHIGSATQYASVRQDSKVLVIFQIFRFFIHLVSNFETVCMNGDWTFCDDETFFFLHPPPNKITNDPQEKNSCCNAQQCSSY